VPERNRRVVLTLSPYTSNLCNGKKTCSGYVLVFGYSSG
jgi:hypothetical protein